MKKFSAFWLNRRFNMFDICCLAIAIKITSDSVIAGIGFTLICMFVSVFLENKYNNQRGEL